MPRSMSLLPLALLCAIVLPMHAEEDDDDKGGDGATALFEKAVFTDGGASLPYRIMKPATIAPKQRYPLVVFLHGAGERGADNERHLRLAVPALCRADVRARWPGFVVAPQCPAGHRWVETDWGEAAPHRTPTEPSLPMRLLLALIPKLMGDHPIDPDRVYVIGMSMGGYGAWDLMIRRPQLMAAAVPICGGADDGEAAARIRHIPVWVFHGARDEIVPVVRSRSVVAALAAAGSKPRYTEYPRANHFCWDPAMSEPGMLEWLFAQRRLPPTTPGAAKP